MLGWLKNINKPYPEFWKNYVSKFEEKTNRYVALGVETTGIDPSKDLVISFGAVAIINDNIIINDHLEISIHDANSNEAKIMEAFVDYIGNAVLVGHRIHFDVEIINEALDKLDCGRLKNEALDVEIMHKKLHDIHDKTFSLKEIISKYKMEQSDRVSSADDAFSIAVLFLKLKNQLGLK